MNRRIATAVGAVVVGLTLSGCGSSGIYSLPLPGGADVGDDPLHLKIRFEDVLDLVPQSAVKFDGVPVGRVEDITVPDQGWTAEVSVIVDRNIGLPENATASIQQSSLLGEKFIDLQEPENPSPTKMQDGHTITDTSSVTQIETVLGALSMLLNGGGVAELQPIVHELTTALDGRETKVRGLLENANSLIAGLNEQRDSITRALDGLDVLSSRVNEQSDKIEKILDEIPTAVGVLEEQRPELIEMLGQLDRLGQAGTDVLLQSKDDLIADLRALQPTLQALADNSNDLVKVLPLLPTFPFPDGVEKIIKGNSLNLFLTLNLQVSDQLNALGVGQGDPVYIPPKYGTPLPTVDPLNPYYNGNGPAPGWPTVSLLPLPPLLPRPQLQPAGPNDGAAPNPLQDFLDRLGIGGP